MAYVRTDDGVRINYEIRGPRSGTPVVLIQGLGADRGGWIAQRIPMLFKYRTLALDNRGAGRSDKPLTPWTMERMVDDVIAAMDDAGLESAHIVGASMGGGITQLLGVKYPERTRSLSLVCTACRNHPWRLELLDSWRVAAETSGMGHMTKEAARWTIGPRSFRRLVPLLGWLGPLALGSPASAFANQVDAILGIDDEIRDALGALKVPVLVVVGNQDILTPRGDSEELADLIPTAELVVISGAAHGMMIEHASTFNKVLFEFVDRAERAWHRPRAVAPTPSAHVVETVRRAQRPNGTTKSGRRQAG